VPTASGAALLVRTKMAVEIGLFDAPFYMYHEDIDATFNFRIHGWKSVIEPSSIIYHYYEFSRSIGKFYWMERNRYVVNLTYLKLPTLLLTALPFFGVELASLVFAVRGGWWRQKLRAWGDMWKPSTWRWILARRARAQRERKISDREFLKWAVGDISFQEGNTDNFVVNKIANPLLSTLWRGIYFLIRW
jgi:GT2 family glycosyltransferase